MQDEPTGPGETGAPTTPPDGALSGTKAVEATVDAVGGGLVRE